MPIAVACPCGKQFKVKDEMIGTVVTCQVCGQAITVSDSARTEIEAPLKTSTTPVPVRPETKTCPACAEDIPANVRRCPHCHEDLAGSVSAEGQAEALVARVAEVNAYVKNVDKLRKDEELKGGFLSIKSKVIVALEGIGALSLLCGFASRNSEGLIVVGVILLMFFTIPVIITLINDARSRNIQEAQSATAALKSFLLAVSTNRANRAFAALAPAARNVKGAKSITFANKKIAAHSGTYAISDPVSLGKYWKTVFSGPSGNTRTVRVKTLKVVRETAGVALVEADLECTSYSSWIILTVFINLLLCLLLILAIQQKETVTIRKLLIKRGGKWFIAESELQGPLDRISSPVVQEVGTEVAA